TRQLSVSSTFQEAAVAAAVAPDRREREGYDRAYIEALVRGRRRRARARGVACGRSPWLGRQHAADRAVRHGGLGGRPDGPACDDADPRCRWAGLGYHARARTAYGEGRARRESRSGRR